MIGMEETTLSSFLYKVKKSAINNIQANIFYSYTKEIQPVSFLEIFDRFNDTDINRYYWSNHHEDFSLLGIDTLYDMTASHGDMKIIRKAWKTLLNQALEHNPYKFAGTGITAMGGMSFDSNSEPQTLWENYPSAHLIIPKWMIAYTEGRYFLTNNGYINEQTILSELEAQMNHLEARLYEPLSQECPTSQKILTKQEVKPDAWKELVEKAVDEIKTKKAKKIVLARELKVRLNQKAHVGRMLRRLRKTQPNSYVFAYESEGDCFIGATPERLVQVNEDKVLSTCLAGTTPRGETKLADKALADDLLHDEKNLQEHGYVVQMIKENIAFHCKSIDIPEKPVIYPLQNLQHLYTPVKATLKEGHDVFDMVQQLHPTPALGGVPREKALAFIREEEFMDRGWYGAPIGWLDSSKHSEFAVAIRSGLVHEDEVTLFAGCGVMGDSDPEMEFEETKVKFLPMLHVLEDPNESY